MRIKDKILREAVQEYQDAWRAWEGWKGTPDVKERYLNARRALAEEHLADLVLHYINHRDLELE